MKFAYADPSELAVGAAGEHLVCADLLMHGMHAFLSTQACPYDVAFEWDNRIVRVQVKATRVPRPLAQKGQRHVTGYVWNLRRGKGASRAYRSGEFDVLAAVALDTKEIAWLRPADVRQTFIVPVSGNRTACKTFADFTLHRAMESL